MLQARLALGRSGLSTVQGVLDDLEKARHPGSDRNDTDGAIEALEGVMSSAVRQLRTLMDEPSDVEGGVEDVARQLYDAVRESRKSRLVRAQARRTRLKLTTTEIDKNLGDEVTERLDDLSKIESTLVATPDELEDAWSAYQLWSAACLRVFRDYVDLVRGVLLRDSGLDNDLCRIADVLVSQTGQWKDYAWGAFTIPASEDHGDASALRLIRIGFPEWSVWSLPLTMYEIGHVFAEINHKMRPIAEDARREAASAERTACQQDGVATSEAELRVNLAGDSTVEQLRKWIADAYATARLGPGYVWAAMLLRADPTSDEHHRRLTVVLEVLDQVAAAYKGPVGADEFAAERTSIFDEWCAARTQVGAAAPEQSAVETELLTDLVGEVLAQVTVPFGPREWSQSLAIADQLTDRAVEPKEIASGLQIAHLRHVLAAAWKARVNLANEQFEDPSDLASDDSVDLREGFAVDQRRRADMLATRTREVCIAMMDIDKSAAETADTGGRRSQPPNPDAPRSAAKPNLSEGRRVS